MKLVYRIFFTVLFCLILASCGNGGQQRLLDVASILFQKGKTEEAMKVYDDIIKAFPNCKEAYFNKGIILYQKKLFDKAIELFSKSIEVDPMYGKAYLYRGKSYFNQSDLKSAEFDFKSAQIDKETAYESSLELGMLYVRKKEFDKGLKYLNMCVQQNDTNQIVLLSRASAYFEMENFRASIIDCNKVLHKNNTRWEAFLIKAKNYINFDNMDSAKINLDFARMYSQDNSQVFAVFSE
jgi:tetratricopeptide (TPR) repeat protein